MSISKFVVISGFWMPLGEPDFAVDPADFPPDIEETDGTEYENQVNRVTAILDNAV